MRVSHLCIHHVSLLVADLERAKTFYTTILGLRLVDRPPFDFEGAWLAIGETGQQLHLIVHEGETRRSGGIDTRDGHFAIRISHYDETIRWLEQHQIEFKANPNSRAGFPQIFLLDPDRNIIELNAERL